LEIIDAHQNNFEKINKIGVVLTNTIKMETLSFLEEFNNAFFQNIEDEYKPKMMEVREITAPIIKRIRKWKDLGKFRNNIIAHPWRDKGKFVTPDPRNYDVPDSYFEVGVLVNLIKYIWSVIRIEFEKEMSEAILYMLSLEPPNKEFSDHLTINEDHLQMAHEVDEICKRLNKPYYLRVMQYNFFDEKKDHQKTSSSVSS
jgi:hypothetical protein